MGTRSLEYIYHKFIKGNTPNYTCVPSNQRLGLANVSISGAEYAVGAPAQGSASASL